MIAFSGRPDPGRPRAARALGLLVLALSIAWTARAPWAATGDPQRAELLFRRYCAVCHGHGGGGDGPNAPYLEEDRPRDLTDARYVVKLSDEHLYRVIQEGGRAIQGSRFMPPWGRTLSPSQIRDLVAYTRTLAERAARPLDPAAGARAGATLVRELGCPACHQIGDLPSIAVAPDLSAEGSRVQRAWLVRFLRAPHAVRPAGYHPLSKSRMPDLGLSDEEAASLAEYLLTRRDGALEAGPESTQAMVQGGLDLFRQYACRACHSRDGSGGRAGPDLSAIAQRLKPRWVMRFIQDPQAADPLSPMPHLGVGEEAARAITRFLFGGRFPQPDPAPDAAAVPRGRTLFKAFGCAGCHGGERDAANGRVGPDLTGAGDKLRPEWLSDFLRRPSPIRPWLTARMPDFRLTEAETRALVGFISDLTERAAPPLPERLRFSGSISEVNVQAGRRLVSRDFLSCSSCHVGEERPEGPPEGWAPDLRTSARRLKPDWIVRWLQDPQRLAPGTKMPSFFTDESSGPEDILGGDEERQILALRDYILSLGSGLREPKNLSPAIK